MSIGEKLVGYVNTGHTQQRNDEVSLLISQCSLLSVESCSICGESVQFTNPYEEVCGKGHRSPRCRISLVLCPVVNMMHRQDPQLFCSLCEGVVWPKWCGSSMWSSSSSSSSLSSRIVRGARARRRANPDHTNSNNARDNGGSSGGSVRKTTGDVACVIDRPVCPLCLCLAQAPDA